MYGYSGPMRPFKYFSMHAFEYSYVSEMPTRLLSHRYRVGGDFPNSPIDFQRQRKEICILRTRTHYSIVTVFVCSVMYVPIHTPVRTCHK